MKRLFKSIVTAGVLLITALSVKADITTWTLSNGAGIINNVYLLSTNPASAYKFTISSAVTGTLKLYDNSATNAAIHYGTNYIITNSYVTAAMAAVSYASNFVNYMGVTNWWTNTGYATTYTTNSTALTNELPVMASFSFVANTPIVYNVSALFSKGIVAYGPTLTNTTVIMEYNNPR